MGGAPAFELGAGQCALLHTGGMLPAGADSAVMLEHTQGASTETPGRAVNSPDYQEIEVLRAIAEGENVIRIGEDVAQAQTVISSGSRLRPAEIGGLMALGITAVRVAKKVLVGLVSSGDEVIDPMQKPRPGQVRDVNAYSLASLVTKAGGEPVLYGIVRDQMSALKERAAAALQACDMVAITAGSSASTRDMTAEVIGLLGAPGVLVHGINTRPGKPTILGVCDGKPVIGLPGNPVSALVNGYLFIVPVIEKLLGLQPEPPRPSVLARLTINLPSQAGREDWIPVTLVPLPSISGRRPGDAAYSAEPVFGKSNLIFTLAAAAGLLRIPPDTTGLSAGELVEVMLI